jgi:hypothetical protein
VEVTYDDVARRELLTTALELWHARGEVRRQLESRRDAWREESRERWATVLRAIDPAKTIPPAGTSTIFGRQMQDVAPALVSALEARRQWWQWERASFEELAAHYEDAQRYARWLENELGCAERSDATRRHCSGAWGSGGGDDGLSKLPYNHCKAGTKTKTRPPLSSV